MWLPLATVDVVYLALVATVAVMWLVAQRRRAERDAKRAAQTLIEAEVAVRIAALEQQVALYTVFVENTDAIAFEYDTQRRHLAYIAPQVTRLLGSTSNRSAASSSAP